MKISTDSVGNTVINDLHELYSFDQLNEIFVWLKENKINYHCFSYDLTLYNPKEVTLFLLTWRK